VQDRARDFTVQPATALRRTLTVNGELTDTAATTLSALVASLGYAETQVATAVNGDFVPRDRRPATPLGDGDKVEIVAPRQGG
jgi:sulfur carrier protein